MTHMPEDLYTCGEELSILLGSLKIMKCNECSHFYQSESKRPKSMESKMQFRLLGAHWGDQFQSEI
ncbi:hypothetical protein M514_06425 [Trichuris suis]|uniref:Uncharacterized protein n=1 Tax=Trichuris suis TaxID=68888 RepID=A0A085MT25_9BILA|nr:hypothetical protein M514_06425 [Trichuris suis]KHJ42763.1 hypothetical protein D918_07263 [Trichuris suis]